MKKTLSYITLMIFIVRTSSFAIPAKPFRILANKEFRNLDVKLLNEPLAIFPVLLPKVIEPIKSLGNSKISFKVVIDENFKTKISWVSAAGHKVKRYIIQISHDKETFFDLKEVTVVETQEERQLYTFTDPLTNIGLKYYRIMEQGEADRTIVYAPIQIMLVAIPAPRELVKCLQTEENNVIHIKTSDSRLVPILTTETGMGIPCDYKYSEATQTGVLKPLYYLAGGNYHLKVRLGNNESKYIVSVSDLDGMTF
jgi:hypothetical protein